MIIFHSESLNSIHKKKYEHIFVLSLVMSSNTTEAKIKNE